MNIEKFWFVEVTQNFKKNSVSFLVDVEESEEIFIVFCSASSRQEAQAKSVNFLVCEHRVIEKYIVCVDADCFLNSAEKTGLELYREFLICEPFAIYCPD